MARDTHLLAIGFKHVHGGERDFERAGKRVQESGRKTSKELSAVDGFAARVQEQFRRFAAPAQKAVLAFGVVTAAAVGYSAAIYKAVEASARFEQGLVGVGKTADISGARLRALGSDIDELSRRIPVTTDRLLEIAQSAGQLGVSGAESIIRFTETVALLGQASDLGGEIAATALARILNVTGESVDTVDVLASVIVSLGNNFAATESQIARHTGEVARATAVYGIGSAQAAAIATALASFGVQAELSGSAVGRSFRLIESAVKSGGEKMKALSAVSRVSGEEIIKAFGDNPVEAFNLFLSGLREIESEGGNVAESLASVGLKGEEILKVIPVLSKELDTLSRAQAAARQETQNASALTQEAARSSATLAAQTQVLRNQISSAVRSIGDGMVPMVKEIVAETKEWFEANRSLFDQLGKVGGVALSGTVSSLTTVADSIDLVAAALVGLVTAWALVSAIPVVLKMAAWVRSLVAMTAALNLSSVALVGFSSAATAAKGAVASLWAVIAANPITAAAVAVGTLAAGLFLVWQRGRQARREHESFVDAVRAGTASLSEENRRLVESEAALAAQRLERSGVRQEIEDTQSRMEQLAPVAARMREALELGDMDGYRRAREEVEKLGVAMTGLANESALSRVERELENLAKRAAAGAASYEAMGDRIALVEEELAGNAERLVLALNRARTEERSRLTDLDADLSQLRETMSEMLRDGSATTARGFLSSMFMEAREEAQRLDEVLDATRSGLLELDAAIERSYRNSQERVAELFQAGQFERAGSILRAYMSPEEVRETISFQQAITEAAEKFVRTIDDLEKKQLAQAKSTEEQRKQYQLTAEASERAALASREISKAYDLEGADRQKALQALEVENRLRSQSSKLTVEQENSLRAKISVQVEEERRASGAQTIAQLQEQLEAQESINRALQENASRIEDIRLEQEAGTQATVASGAASSSQIALINQLVAALARAREQERFLRKEGLLQAQIDELRDLNLAYEQGYEVATLAADALASLSRVQQEAAGFTSQYAETIRDLAAQLEQQEALATSNALVGSLELEAEKLAELSALKKEDFRNEEAYQSALAAVNLEHEIRAQLLSINAQRERALAAAQLRVFASEEERGKILDEIAQKYDTLEERAEAAIRAQSGAQGEIDRQGALDAQIDGWLSLGDAASGVIADIDADWARMVSSLLDGLSQIVIAFEALNNIQGSGPGAAGQAIVGGASVGAGVAGILQGVGIFEGDQGISRFGASRGGDFSSEGAAAGAVVGAVLGVFLDAFAPGIGSLVGGLIGTVIGGALHKGVDDGTAQLRQTVDSIAVQVTKDEGGLGGTIQKIGESIRDVWAALTDSLGIDARFDLDDFHINVREDFVQVVMDGVRMRFETIEEAVEASVIEMLRRSNVTGGSERLNAVLNSRNIDSTQELESVVELVRILDDMDASAGPAAQTMRELSDLRRRESRIAREHGLEVADINRLYEQRIDQLRTEAELTYESIVGISDRTRGVVAFAQSVVDINAGLDVDIASRQREIDRTRQYRDELQSLIDEFDLAGGIEQELERLEKAAFEASKESQEAADEIDNQVTALLALVQELDRANDAIGDMEEGLSSLPEAIDTDLIANAFNASAALAGQDLINMLRQVMGANFGIAEQQQLATQLYQLQLAAQIVSVQQLLLSTELLKASTRAILEGLLETANDVLRQLGEGTLAVNIPSGSGGGSGGGGGSSSNGADQRRQLRDQFRRDLETARLELSGLGAEVLSMRDNLIGLRERVEEAGRSGITAAEQFEFLSINLDLIQRDLMAPYEELVRRAGEQPFETAGRELLEGYESAFREAYALAIERSAILGTELADEFGPMASILTEALQTELTQAIQDEVDRMTDAGDIEGLQALSSQIEFLLGVLPSDTGPGMALAAIADSLQALIDGAIASTEEERAAQRTEQSLSRVAEAMRALGLPALQAEQSVEIYQEALDALNEALELEAITAAEHAADMNRLRRAAAVGFGESLLGFLDRYFNASAAHEDVRMVLAELRYHAELAQLRIQYNLLLEMGLLSDTVAKRISELFEFIDNNTPDFTLPAGGSGGGGGFGGGVPDANPLDQVNELLADIESAIESWTAIGDSSIVSNARGMREEMDALLDRADDLNVSTITLLQGWADGVSSFVDQNLAQWEDPELSPEQRKLSELIATFSDLEEAFTILGASADEFARLAASRQSAIDEFWNETLSPFEQGPDSSAQDRLASINSQFDHLLELAEQYGGDLERIEAARQGAIEAFWDEALQPLRDYQESLLASEAAGLSPEQRLGQAQARFDDIAGRALAGDLSAIDQLPGAIDALLGEARSFYGTGPAYQALFGSINDLIGQVLGQAPVVDSDLVGGPGPNREVYRVDGLDRAASHYRIWADGVSAAQEAATSRVASGARQAAAAAADSLSLSSLSQGPPRPLPPPPGAADDRDEFLAEDLRSLIRSLEADRAERKDEETDIGALYSRIDSLTETVGEQSVQIEDLTEQLGSLVSYLQDQAASA